MLYSQLLALNGICLTEDSLGVRGNIVWSKSKVENKQLSALPSG